MTEERKSELRLSFFLNMMGVANMKWYETNKIPYTSETKWIKAFNEEVEIKTYEKYYYCGRIDVHNHPEFPFNYEYSVGIMEGKSWNEFGQWLDDLILDYLPDNVEELYQMYEQETGNNIVWWKSDDNQ